MSQGPVLMLPNIRKVTTSLWDDRECEALILCLKEIIEWNKTFDGEGCRRDCHVCLAREQATVSFQRHIRHLENVKAPKLTQQLTIA